MPSSHSTVKTHGRTDSTQYLRKVMKNPFDEKYHQLTFPIFLDEGTKLYMSPTEATQALRRATTRHLNKVHPEMLRNATSVHESTIDWVTAGDQQSGVLIKLTSTLGDDRVETEVTYCKDQEDAGYDYQEDQSPTEIASNLFRFRAGAQEAISKSPKHWEDASNHILDTLAGKGYDVPFEDCGPIEGEVRLLSGSVTDLSIRLKIPDTEFRWALVEGVFTQCDPAS